MGKQKKVSESWMTYCVCADCVLRCDLRPATANCQCDSAEGRRLCLNVGDRRLAVAARTASETEKRSHELPSTELASRNRNLERPAAEGKAAKGSSLRSYTRK